MRTVREANPTLAIALPVALYPYTPIPLTKARVLEAALSVALVVSLFYWASSMYSCREAPAELQGLPSIVYEAHKCDSSIASSSSSSSSSSSASFDGPDSDSSRRLSVGGDAPMYAEINELATLLLQPQEEVPLASRSSL